MDTTQFQVGIGSNLFSGAVSGFPRIWSLLGRLESWVLYDQLEEIRVQQPVYVAGLARPCMRSGRPSGRMLSWARIISD